MHPHLAGYVSQYDMAVFQLYPEGSVRQVFDDFTLHLDYIVFGHKSFQRIGTPPPLKLAFFSSDSYCCDITYDCTCAMKSIVTTTMISSDVPPK